MTDNVVKISSVALVNPEPFQPLAAPVPPVASSTEDGSQHRLTIEQGPDGFVYKTLDRVTGEVIRQLPSEDVIEMRHKSTYGPGELIKTNV